MSLVQQSARRLPHVATAGYDSKWVIMSGKTQRTELLGLVSVGCFAISILLTSPLDSWREWRWHWPWSGLAAILIYMVGLGFWDRARRGTVPAGFSRQALVRGFAHISACIGLLLVLGTLGAFCGYVLFGPSV